MYNAGASAGAAAAAAIAKAIKASGALIKLESSNFAKILGKADKPLVIVTGRGWRKNKFRYMTAYKGLIFYTDTNEALILPSDIELITSEKIWIP